MKKINWTLISGISSALTNFEESFNWSLSVGENSYLFESFYSDLIHGFPKTKKDLLNIFNNAYVKTWGLDNECTPPSDDEMENLLFSCSDFFMEIDQNNRSSIIIKIKNIINND